MAGSKIGWRREVDLSDKVDMPRKISEDQTRKQMIDPSTGSGHRPQLEQAGWFVMATGTGKTRIIKKDISKL